MCQALRALTVHVNNCATSGQWRKAIDALYGALRCNVRVATAGCTDKHAARRKNVTTLDYLRDDNDASSYTCTRLRAVATHDAPAARLGKHETQIVNGRFDARHDASANPANHVKSPSGNSPRAVSSRDNAAPAHQRSVAVDTRLCNAVLHACAHSGMWQECLLLMRDWQHRRGMWQFADTARPDVVSYTLVLRALSREKNNDVWEQGVRLLRTMKRYDVQPNVRTYNTLLALLAKTKQWHVALDLLRTMSTSGRNVDASVNSDEKPASNVVPDIVSYNTVLHALQTGRQWKAALDLLHAMDHRRDHMAQQRKDGGGSRAGVQPTVVSFTTAISACGKEGQWRPALALRDDMARCSVRPNLLTYNALISACEKGGQWQAAVDIFNELRSCTKQVPYQRCEVHNDAPQQRKKEEHNDAVLVSTKHQAKAASGHPLPRSDRRSGKQRNDTQRTNDDVDPLAPDVVSYNALISALAKGQQWERALTLLRAMESPDEASPAPDVISYSATLTACAAAAQWRPALDLLASMQHRRRGDGGPRPNVVAYNATMTACEKGGGQWEDALRILRSMPLKMADTISYNACISAMEKGKGAHWSLAMHLLTTMKENSVPCTVISLNAILSVLGKQGLWHRALDLLATMESGEYEGVKPDTISYNAVMSACEKRHMWRHAIELLARMQRHDHPRPDMISYNACISACEKGGNWRAALQLFHSMGDVQPNVVTVSAAISALARDAGQWRTALELLESCESKSIVANVVTYNAAITACSKGARWTHAMDLLYRMEFLHIQPNVISCNAAFAAIYAASSAHTLYAASDAASTDRASRRNGASVSHGTHASTNNSTQQCVDDIDCVERILALITRHRIAPDALSYAMAIAIARRTPASLRADTLLDRLVDDAVSSASTWVAQGGVIGAARFAKTPYDVVHLYQVLLQQQSSSVEKVLAAPVRDLVFTQAYQALAQEDADTLQELALPNAGPLTRQLLDRLNLHPFDATHAQSQVSLAGAPSHSPDVAAKEVVAHIRYAPKNSCVMVERVVWYSGVYQNYFTASTSTRAEGATMCNPSDADRTDEAAQWGDPSPVKKISVDNRRLPSIYVNHDRSLHAERQALLQSMDDAEGVVELYITHRPCLSCIAAMVTFNKAAHVELKVAFGELDSA